MDTTIVIVTHLGFVVDPFSPKNPHFGPDIDRYYPEVGKNGIFREKRAYVGSWFGLNPI